MIEHDHALSIKRQAQLLSISRSSAYYQPRPVSDAELKLMRRIDELHLELSFAGARMLRDLLRGKGACRGPQAHDHTDAAHGHHGALQKAQHQREDVRAHDLSVPAAHVVRNPG